ncbi:MULTISPECIES: copper resistance D family protein [Colwellia]|uniref:Copper resistance protein D n=1 Tax=Colwellia marinimaniae TaxID=1513592 RepID=A0ABQ0MW31_9GAMM|nr:MULTISPECIES: CopD family protein [Colwellia]GAW96573.1 copper-binding protein [Colwellia marinimaniae]
MEISPWDIAIIISKLMIYIGISGAVGGIFIYWLVIKRGYPFNLRRHCQLLLLLGVFGTILNFFMQVGAFAEAGLSGVFDAFYNSLLWQSNAGESLLYRLAGFILALISVSKGIATGQYRRIFLVTFILSALLLVRSFSVIGHTAEMNLAWQLLLNLHVLLVFCWLGSLWPLWKACGALSAPVLHDVMQQFGYYASYIVSLLILCGLMVAYQLFGSIASLFFTSYGQSFLLKLALVMGILLIAAQHKFNLVAKLIKNEQGKQALARSIQWEMILALGILLTTTWLTTVVGPDY